MPPNQPNRSNNTNQTTQNFEITNELAQSFLSNRQSELAIESRRLDLQNKQLDLNADYAKEALRLQAEDQRSRPAENRKTLVYFAVIAVVLLLILIGFVVYCLHIGERDFIISVLKGLSYLATTGLGYYFGQRNSTSSKPTTSDTPSAEVVE